MRILFERAGLMAIACGLVLGGVPQVPFGATPSGTPVKRDSVISKAAVVANPSSYSGPCPAEIQFRGVINGLSGSAVTYTFSYLDPGTKASVTRQPQTGAVGSSGALSVDSSGVVTNPGEGWVSLLAQGSNISAVSSTKSAFKVSCTSFLPPIPEQASYIDPPKNLKSTTDLSECEHHGFSASTCQLSFSRGAVVVFDWAPACHTCVLSVEGFKLYRVSGDHYDFVAFNFGGSQQTVIALPGSDANLEDTCYVVEAYKGNDESKFSDKSCIHLAQPPRWSAHSQPFDAVWNEDKLDGNGLPLNPYWAAQIGQPAYVPNFQQLCGSSFNYATLTKLLSQCTSQTKMLTYNLYGPSFSSEFGHCPWSPIGGHVNWINATYTGTLFWDEYSGNWPQDNDINLNFQPDQNAGLTALNNGYLGLEFVTDETLDNYTSPFWANMDHNKENNSAMYPVLNGKRAVVTGVLGIDGVHNGYSEIHPVFALAVLDNSVKSGDGVDETWQFFIRNSGTEGGCSNFSGETMIWGGPGQSWYFLSIPWPKGATDAKLTNIQAQASDPGTFYGTTNDVKGWSYVGFELDNPTYAEFFDGSLTLHFQLPANAPGRRARKNVKVTGHAPEESDWKDVVARVQDPAQRKKITDFLMASKPPSPAIKQDKFRPTQISEEQVKQAMAAKTSADQERMRHVQSRIDPAGKQAMNDFETKLKAIWPADLKLSQPISPAPQK
jgi:hypothetical protein